MDDDGHGWIDSSGAPAVLPRHNTYGGTVGRVSTPVRLLHSGVSIDWIGSADKIPVHTIRTADSSARSNCFLSISLIAQQYGARSRRLCPS